MKRKQNAASTAVTATLLMLATMGLLAFWPAASRAQSIALDETSPSLTALSAASSDILALPATSALDAAQLGLLAGDVIDAISYSDDAVPGSPGVTVYFSVNRSSAGSIGGAPSVTSESGVGQAAADIFSTNDPCTGGLGFNTQALDGDGAPTSGSAGCYGGAAVPGMGLYEAPPGDNVSAFDWGSPGVARISCVLLSLAPDSPSLVAASNPLLPSGAEPGDILIACPSSGGGAPTLSTAFSADFLGLVSGGAGCAPPACDDIDAISGGFTFSLSPDSPSVAAVFSAADVLAKGTTAPVVKLSTAQLGLQASDDVDALEALVNPCPVAFGDMFDSFDNDSIGGCDNCPFHFNPGQEDSDNDGIGDNCDTCTDPDLDGLGNPGFAASSCTLDLCPQRFSANLDTDNDGFGDECDQCTDTDGDGNGDPGFLANTCLDDSCPDIAGTNEDADSDGVADECDSCPNADNEDQEDTDGDTVADACDNCPEAANLDQADGDGDGQGNACDSCPAANDSTQADFDEDGIGDLCDPCPHVASAVPAALTSLKSARLDYRPLGPGFRDDRFKTSGSFASSASFDLNDTDDVFFTLSNTVGGARLATRSLTAASGLWTQKKEDRASWSFYDEGDTNIASVKGYLKESPNGSGKYKFMLDVKDTSLPGPNLASGDGMHLVLEIAPAGLCFDATLATCKLADTKDSCKP